MKEHKFEVIAPPFGKQRPRHFSRGKFVTVYTPQETKDYEALVKQSYIDSKGFKFEGPVKLTVDLIFVIPKSYSNKKTEECLNGTIYPEKKPDIDNCIKAIMDGLNGEAYHDDKNVVEINVRKIYGEEAKAVVILSEV